MPNGVKVTDNLSQVRNGISLLFNTSFLLR
jgi:hypothetical protein